LDFFDFAFDRDHFKTMAIIKMDMHGGTDYVLIMMLSIRQAFLYASRFMIVDYYDCPRHNALGFTHPSPLTEQVAHGSLHRF
jgi:hypothetical protein